MPIRVELHNDAYFLLHPANARHKFELFQCHDRLVELIRIGHHERDTPLEISAFACDGKRADVDAKTGNTVG